jgi:hypothetical protein
VTQMRLVVFAWLPGVGESTLVQPSWAEVVSREWQPWSSAHHAADIAHRTPDDALAQIRQLVTG